MSKAVSSFPFPVFRNAIEREPGFFIIEKNQNSEIVAKFSQGENKLKIILEENANLDFKSETLDSSSFILDCDLTGEGASITITNISKAQNSQIQKSLITIIHSAPNTRSSAKSKAVSFDSACVEMKTIAKVESQAHGSKSRVECKALLLGENAKARADPILEILNNDVECSHAASIKEIEKEKIFYLQTRGMNEQEAKSLIVDGFLSQDS